LDPHEIYSLSTTLQKPTHKSLGKKSAVEQQQKAALPQ
jgi:hypothetical protein